MSREHEVRLPYYRLRTVFLVPGSIEIKNMKIAHLHQQNLDIGIKVKRNTYLIPSSQSHSSKIHIKKHLLICDCFIRNHVSRKRDVNIAPQVPS